MMAKAPMLILLPLYLKGGIIVAIDYVSPKPLGNKLFD